MINKTYECLDTTFLGKLNAFYNQDSDKNSLNGERQYNINDCSINISFLDTAFGQKKALIKISTNDTEEKIELIREDIQTKTGKGLREVKEE